MVSVPAGTGPEVPASVGRFQRGTCVLMSSDMAKMDPSATDMALELLLYLGGFSLSDTKSWKHLGGSLKHCTSLLC
jgi:hypothetical protein